jgi:predicted nucleic acid-binding protein
MAARKNAGRRMSQSDAVIAAVARSRGASLATRNVKDFVDCGIEIINPWQ